MTTQEAIIKVREKLNKNSTNAGVAFDSRRILVALNEAQNKFLENSIDVSKDDESRYIQKFVVTDFKLKEKSANSNSKSFHLPDNHFDFINVQIQAESDKCKQTIKWPVEIKPQNEHEILSDENNKPSFYYSEVPYYLTNDSIKVFFDGFKITGVSLNYYRYPNKISVPGLIMEDGSISDTINPEWDDKAMDRIISITVKDLDMNIGATDRLQSDIIRINQKQ